MVRGVIILQVQCSRSQQEPTQASLAGDDCRRVWTSFASAGSSSTMCLAVRCMAQANSHKASSPSPSTWKVFCGRQSMLERCPPRTQASHFLVYSVQLSCLF